MMQIIIILLTPIFIGIAALLILNKAEFGAYNPMRTKLQHSKQYSAKKKRFMNEHSYIVTLQNDSKVSLGASMWRYFFGKNQKPSFALPEIKPDLEEFLQKSSELKYVWFGHSSFMMNFNDKILLFDPVFSKSAAPFSFITKRFQKPVLSLEQLPNIDYIVLSHDHYDHLDMETIKFFKNTNTKFLCPLGVGKHLEYWGINGDRVTELDWWQTTKFGNLEFILTPAQHFSGRKIIDYNHTLWGSWVVRDANRSIFFSGDSGYARHFQEIGNKYGPFDLVFIENGQYDPAWRDVHMLPKDVMQAVLDLKAKRFMPIHWGMFCLAPHQWFDPIESIFKLAQENNVDVYTPKIGQIITLNNTKTTTWWRELAEHSDITADILSGINA